jgi:hypothetical protein
VSQQSPEEVSGSENFSCFPSAAGGRKRRRCPDEAGIFFAGGFLTAGFRMCSSEYGLFAFCKCLRFQGDFLFTAKA